jgi:DNA-binding response OmpR family regulator
VLVVDDDAQFSAALVRDLKAREYVVETARGVDEALSLLRTHPFDVLLTDLRMDDRDGIDLLAEMRAIGVSTRPILMSAYATARDSQKATELGAVRILCKPFGSAELAQAIQQAVDCGTGFRGSVHGLSLIDMLQMFHFGRRSIVLKVEARVPGEIHFNEGEIVHAARGPSRGEQALSEILGVGSGAVHTEPTVAVERTVHRSFESLLLDLLRTLDEQGPVQGDDDLDFDAAFRSMPPKPGSIERSKEETHMGKIDDACKEVVESVDGAVAAGVVDLDTGMLLGIYNASQYTSTLNEVVAAATMDLFRGPNVGRIEQMVRAHRGIPEDGGHYFEEVHVTSRNNFHFAKTLKGGRAVMMLVTKKTTNIGMGWAQLKSKLPMVEPLVP